MITLSVVGTPGKTITFQWTPVQGAQGYLFYKDDMMNPVSRSFDPTKTTTRFAYSPSSKYKVEAIKFTVTDQGVYPIAPPPPPPPVTESPDNTVITAPSTAAIVDASGNKWTISSGKVAVNGTIDSVTSGVIKLAYETKKIWQGNSNNLWWYKTKPTDTWLPTGGTTISPIPGALKVMIAGNPVVAQKLTGTIS